MANVSNKKSSDGFTADKDLHKKHLETTSGLVSYSEKVYEIIKDFKTIDEGLISIIKNLDRRLDTLVKYGVILLLVALFKDQIIIVFNYICLQGNEFIHYLQNLYIQADSGSKLGFISSVLIPGSTFILGGIILPRLTRLIRRFSSSKAKQE